MITDYTSSTFPVLKPSDVESRRFDRVVHRLTVPINCNWSDDEIATLGKSAKSDLVILRSPASRNRLGGVLGSLSGYQTLHADSLLYFSKDLTRALDADQIPERLHLATDSPVTQQLSRLILATFAAYQNHYSANPSLQRDAVEKGYAEWAASIASSRLGTVLTINDEEQPVSFIVVSSIVSQNGERHAEISLNGTHPAYRNKGLYRILLTHCMKHLASHDVKKLWISTQASHRVMIRTWEKLGLGFELGLNTYHVSPIGDY